jgi:hypothetical protein
LTTGNAEKPDAVRASVMNARSYDERLSYFKVEREAR